MEENRKNALSSAKRIWAQIEELSDGTALTLNERNELIKAKLATETLIDSLSYPQGMKADITEASFPVIGPFNTGELSVALAGLSVRSDAKPEKVQRIEITTKPNIWVAS